MPEPIRTGPLAGLTIVEMAGIGPAPLACLMLVEMGARVVRIDRIGGAVLIEVAPEFDLGLHGRERLSLDLKQKAGQALALRLIAEADVLVDPFRPGVMERLGLGPDIALAVNPRLIYARMTGFGQDGPMAPRAGHDLSYLALSGLLHAIGPAGAKPVPPLNLVADYGGGAMFLISGILAALVERAASGKGQSIDVAMTDGAAMLGAPVFAFRSAGIWEDRRGSNLLDGGAPFYDTYGTSDDRHLAVCCLEPRFFAEFARLLPLDGRVAAAQYDRTLWPDMRAEIAARLSEKTRDEWAALFEGTDACVTPVLSLDEVSRHPHNAARSTFIKPAAMTRPAPAPRFSRTPSQAASEPSPAGPADILASFGITGGEAGALASAGIVGQSTDSIRSRDVPESIKPDVIRKTDADGIRLARTLIRQARYGALAVLDPVSGTPLASRVAVATNVGGAPLILVSSLSAHTGALLADPRCSLLLGEPGKGDPLAHPRITLVCRASKLERGAPEQIRAERRYLAKQPKAAFYAGFPDFAFFRLDPQRASLNGGFGKAYLLERADLMISGDAVEALADMEEGAVAHMNADHADAIQLYARHFGGAAGADGPWRLTGLDADGMDLAATSDVVLRVFYPEPLAAAADLRKVLAGMARQARDASGAA